MKTRVTRTQIKSMSDLILRVKGCGLYYLFCYDSPDFYSTRSEGWACDYYYMGDKVYVSTGDAPIGVKVPYEITKKYNDAAKDILDKIPSTEEEERKVRLWELQGAFLAECEKYLNK